jgi:hypothetical protein
VLRGGLGRGGWVTLTDESPSLLCICEVLTHFVCCVSDMTDIHSCCIPLRLLGPSSLASFLQVMHHCAVVACDGLL